MFAKIAFIFVSLLSITAPTANATLSTSTAKVCRQEFAHDVITCVVTAFFQTPKARGEQIKTCIRTAKVDRQECLNGGSNQCELACQATHDENVLSCEQTYDPAICSGSTDPLCVTQYQQERANCISAEADALNACTAACN